MQKCTVYAYTRHKTSVLVVSGLKYKVVVCEDSLKFYAIKILKNENILCCLFYPFVSIDGDNKSNIALFYSFFNLSDTGIRKKVSDLPGGICFQFVHF